MIAQLLRLINIPLQPLTFNAQNTHRVIELRHITKCHHLETLDHLLTKFLILSIFLQVVSQMPECHINVFRYISAFLSEMLKHAAENKLGAKILGKWKFF